MSDIFTKKQRSVIMSRIRGSNTALEKIVFKELRRRNIKFIRHYALLPGKPDMVFKKDRVAVFIHSDFWHGWQYPKWGSKLSPFWKEKIQKNKLRDRKVTRALRNRGWIVSVIWEHDLKRNLGTSINKAMRTIRFRKNTKHC